MKNETRRNFLKSATGAAVGLTVLTNAGASANDTINVACVGLNGRGQSHIDGFKRLPNVKIAALCDVDEEILNDRAERLKNDPRFPNDPKKYTDIKDLLQNEDIDAVTIATPNHWHSLMAIWACQAGKDVYVEKPLSHNIYEGRKLVEAAKKYNRIVQHGTQIRSNPSIQEAMKMLHDGLIGEVYYAKGTCYKWRNTIGHTPESEPPEGVHYNEWLGPADQRPYSRNRFHYNWHWHWDYGNGDIGNQGVHQFDVARWGLNVGLPSQINCLGGHFMFDDDQETPNTMVATYKYPEENKMMVFEVRHWITQDELGEGGRGNVVGNLFLGSKGYMVIPSYSKYQVYLGRERKPGPSGDESGDHWANFIDCVRSRKVEDLNAPVEEGHLSSALCHLANAAYLTERTLRFDPKTERCIDDDQANMILCGDYRTPFTVPEEI